MLSKLKYGEDETLKSIPCLIVFYVVLLIVYLFVLAWTIAVSFFL